MLTERLQLEQFSIPEEIPDVVTRLQALYELTGEEAKDWENVLDKFSITEGTRGLLITGYGRPNSSSFGSMEFYSPDSRNYHIPFEMHNDKHFFIGRSIASVRNGEGDEELIKRAENYLSFITEPFFDDLFGEGWVVPIKPDVAVYLSVGPQEIQSEVGSRSSSKS